MTGSRLSLLRRLESRIRSQLGLPFPWVRARLLGREVVVRHGTVEDTTDYDDGWLHACLAHSTVVYDIGANIGRTSLAALLCPNVQHVVLIDANHEALAIAADNLIRNQLSDRARFVYGFASDRPSEEVDFWTIGSAGAGSMFAGHAISAARLGLVRRVPTITVDNVVATTNIIPTFVKIDVEGAEARALRGATKLASEHPVRFLVEMHSAPELPMHENGRDVLAWAESVGYAVWYLAEATRISSPDPIAHRGRCHLLIQPRASEYPPWLVGIKQSTRMPGV